MKRLFLSMVAVLTAFILQAQETFTTSGVQLKDATGQPFVIVGMNNPHAWFGEQAYLALDDIASTRANTVRIVWNTRGRADDLERIISRCIDLKMIPMVELHDVTGNNKENAWLDIVDHRDWKTPTQWGNEVIDGENGIRQTAVTANVFAEDYKK